MSSPYTWLASQAAGAEVRFVDSRDGRIYADDLAAKVDPDTAAVVFIGEIGGLAEQQAADYIRSEMTKPIIAFIAGAFVGWNVPQPGFAIIAEDWIRSKLKMTPKPRPPS